MTAIRKALSDARATLGRRFWGEVLLVPAAVLVWAVFVGVVL